MQDQWHRRRPHDEMLLREDDHDDDDNNNNNTLPRYGEAPAATNDFASLEAMLASQTSDNGTTHGQRPWTHQRNEHMLQAKEGEQSNERDRNDDTAPPSSPSTLSNDSLAAAGGGGGASPQTNPPQRQPQHLHNIVNEQQPRSRMQPTAKTLPPTSRDFHENFQRPHKRTPTVAHTAKSIVGSRPKHWGAATVSSKTNGKKGGGRSDAVFLGSSRKRKALLAAELQKSNLVARSIIRNSLKPTAAAAAAQDDSNNNVAEQLATANVSFAPSFFSPQSTNLPTMSPTEEAIMDPVENSDDTVMLQLSPHPPPQQTCGGAWMSPTPPQPWAPHPQRSSQITTTSPYSPAAAAAAIHTRKSSSSSSKQRMGPLRKRLQAIRSAVDGDAIRLQSGQYPFSIRRCLDRNDPRNRATTVCDLTILGHAVVWGTTGEGGGRGGGGGSHYTKHPPPQQQQRLVTVLSYVHSWTRPLVRSSATNSDTTTRDDNNNDNNSALGLAWAVFTHDKAREQSLGNGTQLRVYNAIGIPACDKEWEKSTTSSGAVRRIILCTNLCEPYPSSVLPPLPNVSATTGAEAMTL